MEKVNKRTLGYQMETEAANYLCAHGFQLLERNYRCKIGEIDLIGYADGYLVFAEVKFRKSKLYADPLAAVHKTKQIQICRVADWFRMSQRISNDYPVRYDVVGIMPNEIVWIKNAFMHHYRF